MARINNKARTRYRKTIRSVVQGLSRKVAIYRQPTKADCPNCFYDKLTNRSTSKCKWTAVEAAAKNDVTRYKYFVRGRCPICHDKGYLETQRKVWVDCKVTWDPLQRGGNQMVYTPAGTEGSTIVELKTHTKHYDLFKNCLRLVVDGVECRLSRPPILRGLGAQALLIITAFTTEKPKTDSSEIVKDYTT